MLPGKKGLAATTFSITMTKEPYHVCVASIQAAKDLDQIFENGGSGQLTEGRRWTSVVDLQKKAESEGRPFVVVFSDAESLPDLLYFAEVGKIKIHRTKDETTFAITNMEKFASPRPPKIELFSHRDTEDMTDLQKRPYIFCKTPAVLLEAKRPKTVQDLGNYKEITTRNVRSELYHVIHQENLRRVRSENELLFEVSADFIQHLEDDGYSVDEEMINEMREDSRNRDSDRLSSHLRHFYGLDVAQEEVAGCETVENFVDLVKTKLIATPREAIKIEQEAAPLEASESLSSVS